MALFGTQKTENVLGVDISSSGIKLVELGMAKNGLALQTYGHAEFALQDGMRDPLEDVKPTAMLLKKVHAECAATTKRAIAGIPMSKVFSSIMSVPLVPDKELKSYVEAQAQKLVSGSLADFQLDWKPLDREEAQREKRKTFRVLVTGARRANIQKYVDLFSLAGLEIASLEPEAFALIRSLVGKDQATIMLIDMGAKTTNISIVERGIPVLSRSINVGGVNITEQLSGILGVKADEGEQMKRDMQYLSEKGASGLPKSLERVLQPILNDIIYIFRQYNEDQMSVKGETIEKIVFSGGSSVLPSLPEYLRNTLQTNVYLGDPWARVVIPEAHTPVLDEIGPKFAVAVGLAMQASEKK